LARPTAPAMRRYRWPSHEAAPIEAAGLGLDPAAMAPQGGETPSPRPGSHLVARRPTRWSNHFFENLFQHEWELTKSPAGAYQVDGERRGGHDSDACDRRSGNVPTMTDHGPLAAVRSGIRKICGAFWKHPDQFADAFARAWFKLTHREPMGTDPSAIWVRSFRRSAADGRRSDPRRGSSANSGRRTSPL